MRLKSWNWAEVTGKIIEDTTSSPLDFKKKVTLSVTEGGQGWCWWVRSLTAGQAWWSACRWYFYSNLPLSAGISDVE